MSYLPFGLALDISAHEYFHAITHSTSGLIYKYQSGALDESLSDIFAAVLEAHKDGIVSSDTWLIGEDITAQYFRRLDHPSSVDPVYPDHMSEYLYLSGSASDDHGGVHINSSIPNHAFFLLSEGGTQASGDSVINVFGIGIAEAADIFYYANENYFVPATDFEQAAYATARVAMDRGRRQLASAVSAWHAVGVIPVWGTNGDGWMIAFLGWTYFDWGSYVYSFDYGWAWWNHLPGHGEVDLYLINAQKWIYTSAEMYPWYYDYSTNSWMQDADGGFN